MSSTRHELEKRFRMVSETIQEPLYCRPIHCELSLPFILTGPPITPSNHEPQHIEAILTQPWTLIIQTGRRRTQF